MVAAKPWVDSMRTKGSNMKLGSVMEERAQTKGSGLFAVLLFVSSFSGTAS